MKEIKYLCVFFYLFLINTAIAQVENLKSANQQTESRKYLVWSVTRQLQWSDFNGLPDQQLVNSGFDAATCATRIIGLDESNDSILIRIYTIFYYDCSWRLGETMDSWGLKHEQKHFDIFEIFSRKLRMDMYNYIKSNYEENGFEITKEYFQQLSKKYSQLADSMGDQYDNETQHSLNIEKQVYWNMKIALMLDDLKEYSNPRIIIMRPKQKGFPRTMIFR